jgi:hypothetical protein
VLGQGLGGRRGFIGGSVRRHADGQRLVGAAGFRSRLGRGEPEGQAAGERRAPAPLPASVIMLEAGDGEQPRRNW